MVMEHGNVAIPPSGNSASQFDALMGADGKWSARDLQGELGYAQWRNFEKAVLAARASIAVNDGVSAAHQHIADSSKSSPQPNGGDRVIPDYRLTRYGAYRVMLECDGNKPEVAAAKHYFAVRTREAETRPVLKNQNLVLMEAMLYEIQATQDRVATLEIEQQEQGEQQNMLTARVDSLEGRSGWYTVMAYCKSRDLPSHLEYRNKLGRIASRVSREKGVEPGSTPDERWGSVNCYPLSVLEEAQVLMGTTK